MSPQPVAPANAATANGSDAGQEWSDLVKEATSGDSPGARQVKRAMRLEGEVAKIRKQVDDNRKYLRLMDANEELSEAQADFLDVFYPEKEKGERRTTDQVEATRLARQAARKDAS